MAAGASTDCSHLITESFLLREGEDFWDPTGHFTAAEVKALIYSWILYKKITKNEYYLIMAYISVVEPALMHIM